MPPSGMQRKIRRRPVRIDMGASASHWPVCPVASRIVRSVAALTVSWNHSNRSQVVRSRA